MENLAVVINGNIDAICGVIASHRSADDLVAWLFRYQQKGTLQDDIEFCEFTRITVPDLHSRLLQIIGLTNLPFESSEARKVFLDYLFCCRFFLAKDFNHTLASLAGDTQCTEELRDSLEILTRSASQIAEMFEQGVIVPDPMLPVIMTKPGAPVGSFLAVVPPTVGIVSALVKKKSSKQVILPFDFQLAANAKDDPRIFTGLSSKQCAEILQKLGEKYGVDEREVKEHYGNAPLDIISSLNNKDEDIARKLRDGEDQWEAHWLRQASLIVAGLKLQNVSEEAPVSIEMKYGDSKESLSGEVPSVNADLVTTLKNMARVVKKSVGYDMEDIDLTSEAMDITALQQEATPAMTGFEDRPIIDWNEELIEQLIQDKRPETIEKFNRQVLVVVVNLNENKETADLASQVSAFLNQKMDALYKDSRSIVTVVHYGGDNVSFTGQLFAGVQFVVITGDTINVDDVKDGHVYRQSSSLFQYMESKQLSVFGRRVKWISVDWAADSNTIKQATSYANEDVQDYDGMLYALPVLKPVGMDERFKVIISNLTTEMIPRIGDTAYNLASDLQKVQSGQDKDGAARKRMGDAPYSYYGIMASNDWSMFVANALYGRLPPFDNALINDDAKSLNLRQPDGTLEDQLGQIKAQNQQAVSAAIGAESQQADEAVRLLLSGSLTQQQADSVISANNTMRSLPELVLLQQTASKELKQDPNVPVSLASNLQRVASGANGTSPSQVPATTAAVTANANAKTPPSITAVMASVNAKTPPPQSLSQTGVTAVVLQSNAQSSSTSLSVSSPPPAPTSGGSPGKQAGSRRNSASGQSGVMPATPILSATGRSLAQELSAIGVASGSLTSTPLPPAQMSATSQNLVSSPPATPSQQAGTPPPTSPPPQVTTLIPGGGTMKQVPATPPSASSQSSASATGFLGIPSTPASANSSSPSSVTTTGVNAAVITTPQQMRPNTSPVGMALTPTDESKTLKQAAERPATTPSAQLTQLGVALGQMSPDPLDAPVVTRSPSNSTELSQESPSRVQRAFGFLGNLFSFGSSPSGTKSPAVAQPESKITGVSAVPIDTATTGRGQRARRLTEKAAAAVEEKKEAAAAKPAAKGKDAATTAKSRKPEMTPEEKARVERAKTLRNRKGK